jgi:hypothetical protein
MSLLHKKLKLRWVFEFNNRKPIRGCWDDESPHVSDSAWVKDKTGLKYAVIEGESLIGHAQHRLIECEGERFVTFKWVSQVALPSGMRSVRSTGQVVGLQLLTPENAFTVFMDGTITKRDLTDHDKKFDLKEYQTRVL